MTTGNILNNIQPKYIKKGSSAGDNINKKYLLADSRSVFDPANTAFAAIRTGLADGHSFIPGLAAQGVDTFIVDHIPGACSDLDVTFIVVDDVCQALSRIAYAAIRGFERGVVITGSIGKTITKELIYRALTPFFKVVRSPRSWNSRIGVPLSIFDMMSDRNFEQRPEIALTEVGIDGPGQAEDRRMSLCNSHHTLVITPITDEHDESFKSHADKIREKINIIYPNVVIYADTDPTLTDILKELKEQHPYMRLIPVTQWYHPTIYHALAEAVAVIFGHGDADIDSIPIPDKRREIFEGGFGNTIFHDHFTPDVRSLREALDFFRRHAAANRPRVLVLGRMFYPQNITCGEIAGIYNQAFDLARQFGIEKIYSIDDTIPSDFRNLIRDTSDVEFCQPVLQFILSSYQSGNLITGSQVLLFGEDSGSLREFSDVCMTAGHDTSLEVDLDAIAHNFNYYRSLLPSGTGLIGMVKASAYGLGAVEISKTLQSLGAAYLAVAVIDEGIHLRQAGISMPIVVLNPITNRYPALFASNLEPAVFSPDELDRLITEAEAYGTEHYPIHIKLDTGMHRVGFIREQITGIAERLHSTRAVKVESVFTHLATADCTDKNQYTLHQIDTFYEMAEMLRRTVGYSFKLHILNTAGMMRFAESAPSDMARLGIGLYGISPITLPAGEKSPLKTVATLRTHIISIKHWPEGTPIGYGCHGVTTRPSIIATIPIGYADGINRHLGRGRASFMVNGVACPTIGNICMDLCMIDVTDVEDVKIGDSVEIFGKSSPVEHLAEILDTIPYEVLTSVSPRVKRVYYCR